MLRYLSFVCLSLTLAVGQLRSEELIHWHENLATARQISQQYKVPILIHFYGDQCMPCKSLEKNVFTRPEVASTMQRYFVPVRINATTDRRTAAEFGVHSWPTDVFVSPDGKTLAQGVCEQNPNNYLQNLQNIALMNRDRNAMLAGAPKTNTDTQTAGGNPAPTPYGRTVSNNLQQAAPGREAAPAPSPYSNPSSGPAPYAGNAPVNALASSSLPNAGQPSLPSPAWQGQSAFGQAQNGLVNAGPIPNATSMTLPPPQSALNVDNKSANLPPTIQWQTSPPATSNAFSQSPSMAAASPALPLAPTVPSSVGPMPDAKSPNGYLNGRNVQGRDAFVDNPHFAASNPGSSTPTSPSANKANGPTSGPQWTSPTLPSNPSGSAFTTASGPVTAPGKLVSSSAQDNRQGASPESQSPTKSADTNLPALDGYCPVALSADPSSWIKGSEKFAIRHRGRVYLLADEEAAKKFLAEPDYYTPVLSGHDPLIFLREGKLVEGSIYDGVLRDRQHIMLFRSEENKKFFFDNYDRLVSELETMIKQQSKP